MPTVEKMRPGPLTAARAATIVRSALARGATSHTTCPRIGAEVEWLVFHADDLTRPVTAAETARAARGVRFGAGGTVSVEPGGQLELSTRAFTDPSALVAAIEADTDALVRAFSDLGLVLVTFGLDPLRPARPRRDLPRYRAMADHFAACSPLGLTMMASTAALQISVDQGPVPMRSWRVLNDVAPVLSAAFANSDPGGAGSARQRIWAETEPCRTAPVPTGRLDDWVDYALDATVMMDASSVSPPTGHGCPTETFRTWLRRGSPTVDDLAVHLTTLFPPVRPRGHLEVRCLDALPPRGRAAAVATVWALTADPVVADLATAAAPPLERGWAAASNRGLSDPELRAAARVCLDAAATSLAATAPGLASACRAWGDEQIGDATRWSSANRAPSTRSVERRLLDLAEGSIDVTHR